MHHALNKLWTQLEADSRSDHGKEALEKIKEYDQYVKQFEAKMFQNIRQQLSSLTPFEIGMYV